MASPQAEALHYILTVTDEGELDRLAKTINNRRQALRRLRGASVNVGSKVRLANVSPKYLNGLTGKITEIKSPSDYTLALDAKSIEALRLTPRGRHIPPGATEHTLRVHMEMCAPID